MQEEQQKLNVAANERFFKNIYLTFEAMKIYSRKSKHSSAAFKIKNRDSHICHLLFYIADPHHKFFIPRECIE